MQFVITNVGLSAAQAAQAAGLKIQITSFSVGSGVNYLPAVTDTALHGTILYTQPVNFYEIISPTQINYILIMDDTVGNFSYGEVGLYLADGTLFALGARTTLNSKSKTTGSNAGDVIRIDAALVLSNVDPATIYFPIYQTVNAKLPELAGPHLLTPPAVSNSNAFIVHKGTDFGRDTIATAVGVHEWDFSNYDRVFSGQTTVNGSGYTTAPTVVFTGGSPTRPASGTATVSNGSVIALTLTDSGSGYQSKPTITLSGGGGTGAYVDGIYTKGVTSVGITSAGTGYVSAPIVIVSGGGGSVYFPAGTYLVGKTTHVVLLSNVSLVGCGDGSNIKLANNTPASPPTSKGTSSRVSLHIL